MARLKLLGGATIEDDGGVVARAVARRHPLALLAVLAASGPEPVSRTKVAGLLWPGGTESRARRRLNACVHRVRMQESLGEAAVLSVGDALQLNEEALECDLLEFERAVREGQYERAVRLWGGPFLDGFQLGGSPEFEHWVDRERARLRDRYRMSLEALAEAAGHRGDLPGAARWWRERVRDDPFDSRSTRRLMETLIGAGNRAAALRVGREHEQLLERELGVDSPPEVRQLVREVGGPEPSQAPESATAPRPDPAADPSIRESAADAPPADHPVAPVIAEVPEGIAARERPLVPSGVRQLIIVGVVLLGLGVVVALSDERSGESGPVSVERSVAVLPFTDLGPPAQPAFLADAMTEEITSALLEVPELAVKSRSSASQFASSGLSLDEFARALGVSHVIEGSVQRDGDRVRVTVQLIDARTDEHVWVETYQRPLGDLLEVQVDVARRVAERLAATFSERERERIMAAASQDPVAYDLYLQALVGRNLSPEQQIRLLRRSLARDSSFWPAWYGLGGLYLGMNRRGAGPQWADSASLAWTRAAHHADSSHLPRIEVVRALAFGGDQEETLARLRIAADGSPSDVTLLAALGQAYRLRGDLPAAAHWLWKAARLDPLNAVRWRAMFPIYWWVGAYESSASMLDRARDLDPEAPELWRQYHWYWLARGDLERSLAAADSAAARGALHAALLRGFAHWWTGDPEAASRELTSYDAVDVPAAMSYLPVPIAAVLYETGDSMRAARILERFRKTLQSQGIAPFEPEWRVFPRLQLAAFEGDRESAVELLRAYVERGGRDYYWLLRSPLFREMRKDPAFRRELSDLGRLVEEMRRRMEHDLGDQTGFR